ncbi:TetR/AcrR family transcriptional regulator [Streptomyces zingiberis]|uniref:TetR/AcrR family transcriptional regulator n=1 Tax=Streptomyces zingiberis TaxID=2053010 RepID=A0ABX1BPZ0_9ACTN|nr:TetR/AcrR family transcriptional regulator [Streptomyces zingiberis]NJP99791.1 TetR/AcrR family transcriptional regulator [Streptomyces zingiberis]
MVEKAASSACRSLLDCAPGAARRSRLTPERAAELYEAVLGLLREVGYEALTMDAVAQRTRSSKATLYRQWKGKPELVVSALRHGVPPELADVDTGTLRGDMREITRRFDDVKLCHEAELLAALGHAIHRNADLHQALRELLIEPEMRAIDQVLQRAVDRGELDADAPARRYVPHLLIGAVVTTFLIDGVYADSRSLTDYLDSVVLPVLGV